MERAQLPPLPRSIRTLTDSEADRLDRMVPGVPDPADCITCGGAEVFRWWNADRSEIVEYDCNCIEQYILHRYLLHCGIGTSYQRLAWVDLTDVEPGALTLAQEYLANPGFVRQGMGMIFYGAMGTGKTSLLSLILRALLAEGHDGYLTTFTSLIDANASGWRSEEDRIWFYRRIKNVEILGVDDIGREMKGRTSYSESVADEVIRHRVAAAKPTIPTTNYDLKDIEQGYGPNVLALLAESSATFEFTRGEFRMSGKQRTRKIEEIRNNLTRPLVLG